MKRNVYEVIEMGMVELERKDKELRVILSGQEAIDYVRSALLDVGGLRVQECRRRPVPVIFVSVSLPRSIRVSDMKRSEKVKAIAAAQNVTEQTARRWLREEAGD